MSQLSSQQLKVFVPARDYALSQRFYRALGSCRRTRWAM
ncbi:glyoxalase [Xanthomonas arboricola pv. juglandis]|nr:glyoxalase [Xanthomonas arboricola pv. juglandis]